MVFNGFWSPKPLVAMVFQWFYSPPTIGYNGFPMVSNAMVANHWSDDGMVMIHRSGLLSYQKGPLVITEKQSSIT